MRCQKQNKATKKEIHTSDNNDGYIRQPCALAGQRTSAHRMERRVPRRVEQREVALGHGKGGHMLRDPARLGASDVGVRDGAEQRALGASCVSGLFLALSLIAHL